MSEKPRFKFAGRAGLKYFWEPLNDAARDLLATTLPGTTPVSWFWGHGRPHAWIIMARAHARAHELGIHPHDYPHQVIESRK